MTDNPNFEGDTMSSTSLIEQAIARVKTENTLTMADMTSTSIDVESWLQVDKYGLHLDKSQEAIESLEVEIDLSEVAPIYMVRFGKNSADLPEILRRYHHVRFVEAVAADGSGGAGSRSRMQGPVRRR